MPIRITGLNSGLDTESIISALVSSYNYKTEKYKKAQTKLSWKQDAWKTLNTKIYSFYTSLDSLRFSKNYNLKSTTCSDTTKATVTATSNAVNGTQTMNILQVAQAGYLTGGKLDSSTTTGTTLAELGYTGGDGTINLTKGDGTTTSISVSQGTTVTSFLTSLKNAGVNASYDDVNKRIFVSSKETGVDNDFTLTGGNVDGSSALSAFGLNVDSAATQATYTSYAKYYDADGVQLQQNVVDAITAYQQAKADYAAASAQNGNLSAAYGYASAYSAMSKALEDSGLSSSEQEKLKTLLSMTAVQRTKSVIGSDGNVYTAKTMDQDGNTILAYKDDAGTEHYIQQVVTYKGSDNLEYKLNSDGKTYTGPDGNTYKSTGRKDADGNVIYSNTTDGTTTEISIKAEVKYYEASVREEGTGYSQIAVDGKTYTQNDKGTYSGADGKEYRLDEAANQLIEVERDASNNITDVVGGATISYDPANKTEVMKTVYDQGAARTDVSTASEALTELKEQVQTNGGLTDKELSTFITNLSTNITAVSKYENTADSVLDAADTASRASIVAEIQNAYTTNGAQGVTDLVNTYADQINANKTIITDSQAVMDENSAVAALAAMEDGTEKDAALAKFIEEVNTAHTIKGTTSFTSDAKKIDGQDAIIKLNGIEYTGSSNSFSINGLTITAQTVTGDGDANAVTITTQTDTQGIYDKVKDFLTQYNSLINEITSLYNADSAKGYDPLSDEEKDSMSDTEVEKWEEKIKDSLLRRDDSLEGLMSSMITSMSKAVEIDGKNYYLSSFGVKTLGYLNAAENQQNAYHIDGDEDDASVSGNSDKLMTAISTDPDSVISFMQGLASNLYDAIDSKMKTSTLSSVYTVYNDKEMASEYSDYTSLIKKWEEKLQTQQDYYYNKFSAMETALSKLNSQTSSLSSLLGG